MSDTTLQQEQIGEYLSVKMGLIARLIARKPTCMDVLTNVLTLGFNNRAIRREQNDIVELCKEYEVSPVVQQALYKEFDIKP